MVSWLVLLPFVLTICGLIVILVKGRKNNPQFPIEEPDEVVELTVAYLGDKAYWVHENVFYESLILTEPDFSTAMPINTDEMSDEEMEKLLFILDGLNKVKGE